MVGSIKFQMLYPPEGDSSILEVSSEEFGEFLHVTLSNDGKLLFTFFAKHEITITQDEIAFISSTAIDRLSITDLSIFEDDTSV